MLFETQTQTLQTALNRLISNVIVQLKIEMNTRHVDGRM